MKILEKKNSVNSNLNNKLSKEQNTFFGNKKTISFYQNNDRFIQRKQSKCFGDNSSDVKKDVFIQPKLKISESNNEYEQEADRVADQIMRMNDDEKLQIKPSTLTIQNRCTECKEERQLKRKENYREISPDSFSLVNEVINSPGKPLDKAARSYMEPRFGYDFSNVRIHNDNKAAESVNTINALAFTVGDHIAFGVGQYSPNSTIGQHLLAHELVHSLQQMKEPWLKTSYLARKVDSSIIKKLNITEIRTHPDYFENGLVRIQFYEARQAVLQYTDGARLTIGLVPELIHPPFESVDYHTAPIEYLSVTESPKELKYIKMISQIPGDIATSEVIRQFARAVKFSVEPISGKIVPNHLNPATAPRLCRMLKDVEKEYVKEFDAMAKGVVKVLQKEKLIIELALLKATFGGPKLKVSARTPVVTSASEKLVGPIGKLTQAEIEQAISASSGRTIELYTKLTQFPMAGRSISFTTDRVLAEAARSGGRIFSVKIPEILLQRLEIIGVAIRSQTLMGNTVGTEIRFLPQAAKLILQFLQL